MIRALNADATMDGGGRPRREQMVEGAKDAEDAEERLKD